MSNCCYYMSIALHLMASAMKCNEDSRKLATLLQTKWSSEYENPVAFENEIG